MVGLSLRVTLSRQPLSALSLKKIIIEQSKAERLDAAGLPIEKPEPGPDPVIGQ
jgi:hypothetical protein